VAEDIAIRFGRALKDLRLKRGWTQTYLAEHLGLDRSYLSDLERGKREVCLRNIEVIAHGFNLSLIELVRRFN
jgi:transcriptional regulator with XRE-family HTH domain